MLAALAAIVATACGGGQSRGTPFDSDWVDDHGRAMAAFERSFRSTHVPLGADVAVGVLGKTTLVGIPLAGGAPWTFKHALHGRPALAGSVVVAAGDGEVFALDAISGKPLWSRPSGGRVRGAGDDGATTVVSLFPSTGYGSVVLVIARDGSVVRQIEDEAPIGVPAIAGSYVFFPWQGRFLSVYELSSGDERARVTLPSATSHVIAIGGVLFAGETTLTRFDDRFGLAERRAASTIALPAPLGGLPGDPVWKRPGTDWLNREADALDKVRLYARPTTHGPAAVDGGRFAATYYRVALGLDAATGALAWASANDADFLGGAAYEGGFAICDARGAITFFDATTGAVSGRASLGRRIDACLVQADALKKPSAVNTTPITEQLARVLARREPELAPVQNVLRREMVRLGGAGSAGETASAPRSPNP